jgi:hypothetical protein
MIIDVPRSVAESFSITKVTAFSTLSNFRSISQSFLAPSAGLLISFEYQNTVAASVKTFILKSPAVVYASPSKNRPTLNQWLRLTAVGRSVGSDTSPPPRRRQQNAIVIRATSRTGATGPSGAFEFHFPNTGLLRSGIVGPLRVAGHRKLLRVVASTRY